MLSYVPSCGSKKELQIETKGKQVVGAVEEEPAAVFTGEQDGVGAGAVEFGIYQHLAATATRGGELTYGGSNYSQAFNFSIGVGRHGMEQGRALGTQAAGVGGIFLVGAGNGLAVAEAKGRAHFKVRIGRIGPWQGIFGFAYQGFPKIRKFVKGRIDFVGDAQFFFFHKGMLRIG